MCNGTGLARHHWTSSDSGSSSWDAARAHLAARSLRLEVVGDKVLLSGRWRVGGELLGRCMKIAISICADATRAPLAPGL